MATETKYNLKLEIGNLVFPETKTVKNKDDKEEIEHEHNLYGVRFNRQIYQPGVIEAEISIKPKPDVPTVIKSLLKKNVTLLKDGVPIAKNYFVYEILPQEKKGVTEQLFMKLTIFSKDKLMTLDKYSKVYVAKKLGSEILDVERKNFTLENESIKVNFNNMRMLKYNHTRVITNPITLKNIVIQISSEFIHPYLVQYNESFYDFLARTANRCGEFLYFEDGKLNLGLHAGNAPTMIDNYSSVTYQNISSSPLEVTRFARDTMKDQADVIGNTNYDVAKKSAAGYPTDAFPSHLVYNSELSQDEYFFPLYADKFSTFTREMSLAGDGSAAASSQIFPLLNQLMSGCTDAVGFMVSYGINEAMTIKGGISAASSANKDGFSKYIDANETTNRAKKLEQGDGQTCAVPFGTLSPEGWTSISYYQDVRAYEEEVQLQMICIDMDTNYADVKLGDRIKLSGDGNTYTVIQIVMEDNTKWTHSYAKYKGEVIPKTRETQNQLIFAIPDREKTDADDEKTNLTFPPVLDVPIVRKAEPQTAFIADNDDPKYQGRVRIVYPWQTENEGKLKALAQAEAEYAKAQKTLAEKQKKLPELEAELKALKNELYDLQWICSDLEQFTALRKEYGENDFYSFIIGERELEKDEDINKLDDEIDKNQKALEKEKKKEKGKQDAKRIESLEMEIKIAQEKRVDLERIQKDNEDYINHLKYLEDHPEELEKRMKEIDDALDGKKDGSKQKAYNDTKKALKDAEKDLKAKKENVDKKANDAKGALVMISSPWVRITTPMATEGGGTFFKPRVGDEVLVNYENGNVERPYVIGSLFSKNVLVPDERINRTVSPDLYNNASIAIVSPNGHGITFKDPSSGDGFISGVYPGLGVVTNFISKVPMPHTKDLAGGIKIGDRYGLYSISMSSDKRSVSISSSLGKVTMNAFTGITISAPNGDVKIEGKNVSISAGNNLSITSGTNIKGAGYEYKRDTKGGKVTEFITEKLANVSAAVDKFVTPFIDTTMARAALEVFLRPIEGTLCVKSKRYLTLEAGSGKAIIKPDRFKKFDAEKLDKENDFFKRMIDCLTVIGPKVDKFCDTYNHLWKDAYSKAYLVSTLGVSYLADPKDPDILQGCFELAGKDKLKQIKENIFDGKLKKDLPYKEECKADLLKKTNALSNSLFLLVNHVTSLESKQFFDGLDGEKPTYIENTLKEVVDSILTEMLDEWKKLYLNGSDASDKFLGLETPVDMCGNATYLRRKMAAMFIMKVAMHPEQVPMQFIETGYFLKGEKYEANLTEENLTDNYWWSKFAMNFEGQFFNTVLRTLVDNTLGAAMDSVIKNLEPLNPIDLETDKLKDRDVWAAGKGGQILFSDQKDATLNFDGGDLKKEDYANRYNIDRMKKVLSGM